MNSKVLSLLLTLATAPDAYPQEVSMPAIITAARVNPAPRINGELDDEAWTHAVPIVNLTQREPHAGAAATERTEMRIVYDSRAMYIGVWCYDRESEKPAITISVRSTSKPLKKTPCPRRTLRPCE